MSAAQTRRSVRRTLHEAEPLTADTEANALLVASELVTNANRHGGGATAFSARIETAAPATDGGRGVDGAADPVLRITVEDSDNSFPHASPHALHDRVRPGGRGWALVLLLADTCAITPLPAGGKRISVTLPLR
ncbi:ATP-binding protein [Kitasatospora sp. SolWspMP-SS2h]|uniref:ATP-binding protein n=1 Tax=Kitasatospora sp. SolWspMP-SS2h TaxID=1305729 RepID=UPI00131489DF|nr:ATP-binding protein [Kitasatospora sp. SolWspMP-SS2h]